MEPDGQFLRQPKHFWANVRTISQQVGYTDRSTSQIKVPSLADMAACLRGLDLETHHIQDDAQQPTELGRLLAAYFAHRANVLNTFVEPRLMDAARAKQVYEDLAGKYPTTRLATMNKQKGDKKTVAYLTAIVNLLVEAYAQGLPCDYDPRALTTVTFNRMPLRTLARRVDGAFPAVVNPLAVWEIKEYYYTTTFGSRVADGVYETLLDGLELEELREHEHIDVLHYLMVDARYTWWTMGRSYLCRIVDMLHMGYVDEVLFGYEVVERLPDIVAKWVELARQRSAR